jgi:hypothetical protein
MKCPKDYLVAVLTNCCPHRIVSKQLLIKNIAFNDDLTENPKILFYNIG